MFESPLLGLFLARHGEIQSETDSEPPVVALFSLWNLWTQRRSVPFQNLGPKLCWALQCWGLVCANSTLLEEKRFNVSNDQSWPSNRMSRQSQVVNFVGLQLFFASRGFCMRVSPWQNPIHFALFPCPLFQWDPCWSTLISAPVRRWKSKQCW